jgi:hypothetical protein
LLQLELREKMTLIKEKESTAIRNSKNYGPIFGGEKGGLRDLTIGDKEG